LNVRPELAHSIEVAASRAVPATVTSKVVPVWPPEGKMLVSTGFGDWPRAAADIATAAIAVAKPGRRNLLKAAGIEDSRLSAWTPPEYINILL
jgi:hypothetical protein